MNIFKNSVFFVGLFFCVMGISTQSFAQSMTMTEIENYVLDQIDLYAENWGNITVSISERGVVRIASKRIPQEDRTWIFDIRQTKIDTSVIISRWDTTYKLLFLCESGDCVNYKLHTHVKRNKERMEEAFIRMENPSALIKLKKAFEYAKVLALKEKDPFE